MIDLKIPQARWVRHHLEATVEAWEVSSIGNSEPTLVYEDTCILDQAKDRAKFAQRVAERVGVGTAAADLEAELLRLYVEAKKSNPPPADDEDDRGRPPRVATKLVRLAHRDAKEFLRTPAGVPMITVDDGQGHHMTMSIGERGGVLRDWLCRAYYLDEGSAPNGSALTDALGPLRAKALFDGAVHPVHLRIAGDAERILIGLGDDTWEAIEVTASGWRIISQPQVKFRRPQGLLPLPRPVRGGTLEELRPFVNLGTGAEADAQFLRFLAFLVDCYRPSGPYAVLGIFGPEGSCKLRC
jgi:hypothetical protein